MYFTFKIRYVPVEPLRQLRLISLLDLSGNRIKFVPNNAFVTLRLKTLKLADNNLTLADNSVRGLDSSLKNLNLKGCQLKKVPDAIRSLKSLAFLDLAQNTIRSVPLFWTFCSCLFCYPIYRVSHLTMG